MLTTPVVRCTKLQLNADIHFLTKESFRGILSSNPHINKVITIKSHVSEAREELLKENYDYVIDLHHNLRSLQVKRLLRKPSYSFPKLNIEKWLLVNAHLNFLPQKHIVDRYFETVKETGVKNDGGGLDFFIPGDDIISPGSLPGKQQQGYVAFTAGAKFGTKQLPVAKMITIIQRLNRPVILLGGKEDFEKSEIICKELGELVYNACGKYNLNQSASIVKQADFVIAHDTGLMHIAAAFHKKIISVWGNTVPEFGMYPYKPGEGSKIVEVKDLYCRPCSKIGYAKCPLGHFRCMNDLDVDVFREE